MEDETRSEISEDQDSLASGRISRWETEQYDQQSQISDATSVTATTNMSQNESENQSQSDSRTEVWTNSNATSRNESLNQNRNKSENQSENDSRTEIRIDSNASTSGNEPQTLSKNESGNKDQNESRIESRNDSPQQNQNESVNQNRTDSRTKGRNETINQSRNNSRNKNTNDSRTQIRNESRSQSRTDSQNKSRNDSRNQSQNDLLNRSRNDSRNRSRNDSRNQSRNDLSNRSRNDSMNQNRNDSQNQNKNVPMTQSLNVSPSQSENDSQDQIRKRSRTQSFDSQKNLSRNHSQDDIRTHSRNNAKSKSKNDPNYQKRNSIDSRQCLKQDMSEKACDNESTETKTIDAKNDQREFETRKSGVSPFDSVSLVSSKSQTKTTETSKCGSRNSIAKQDDEMDPKNMMNKNQYEYDSRNINQSVKEKDVNDSISTQNLKSKEYPNSKQKSENHDVKKESELHVTAKEYNFRRASMPEVKQLANLYRNKGETEVDHSRAGYSYRIAAEIRRPLLRTRRRKRIYGSDMYTSDGEMRRENGLSRTQSDMTENRLPKRTNSQRKLSDVVSSEVFRVRRRMSMPVQHTASSPEGQHTAEIENTLPYESEIGNVVVGDEQVISDDNNQTENTNQENKIILEIDSHNDDIETSQERLMSQNSSDLNNGMEENDENTQNIEKHQSVYDIYLELRKMRQVAADCVGTEVRQTIEKKLDKLQSETREIEEENNWRRIQQKIIKIRKKLKEQEQKEKAKEQGYGFLLDILNDIISNVVSGCSDEKTLKSSDQTNDEVRVEFTTEEENRDEQSNTPEMPSSRTQSQNTVYDEGKDSQEPLTYNCENKDTDNQDEETSSVKSDETVTATNTSPCVENEIENKSDNEYEDSCKTDSPSPGSASRVSSREEKVTFSLGKEQERDQKFDVDKNRSVSISRATSATSSSGKTTPLESPFDLKYELEACRLEKISDWSLSSDSETEDTFISELETPESKYNTHFFRDRNDLGDEVISCIIQTSYGIQIPFGSSIKDPVELPCIVDTYEVVLSYFVKLTSSDPCNVISEDIITIAIPYDREEMKYYQEPVLRALKEDGQWRDVDFTDKIYNDDDNMCITVLETSVIELTVWAVVARPTIDYLKFDDTRNEALSSTDNDISISVPPGSRYNPLNMKIELKVIPIISEILQEAKTAANNDMNILFRCSSLVTVDLEEEPSQPISITIPCNKPYTRPQTGSRSSSRRSARRSATLRLGTADSGYRSVSRLSSGKLTLSGANEKQEETENHLVRFGDGLPLKHKMIKPKEIDKHGKIVCTVLEKSCTLEKGHNLTHGDFRLIEGDVVRLSFRGNITPLKDSDKVFKFYGIHGFQTDWTIGVVDIYSQRSLQYFCGFVQIYKWKGDTGNYSLNDWRKWQLVSEVQVTLPKAAPRASPFTSRAPVRIKCEGPITIEYLVSLANRIGDEWPQLARALRIEHARLQSIIQQNHNNMVANLVVDILLAWLKRSPHSKDKALVLAYALRHCGRKDLSDEVREKDRYHKMERSSSARESRIESAIQTVSRCPSASTRWKPLAQGLGLSDIDLMEIEQGYHDENQRCEQMLHLWKQKETEYRLKTLVSSLRHIGCKYVADHLDSAKR